MGKHTRHTIFVGSVCLAALAFAGCSGQASSATTADGKAPVAGVSGGDSKTANYPDWAQAVVPPYVNAKLGIPLNQKSYQIQSDDNLDKVGAWYKSKVSGTWKTDATSGTLSTTVGDVKIGVYKDPAGGPTTMISIEHL